MITNHLSLLAGVIVGFSVAVPIGPMGLLCIQRTLASGMRIGVSTGLGAATVNVLFGALIILGLDRLAPLVTDGGRVLSFCGGVFLLWSAARTMLRRRSLGTQIRPAVLTPLAAYGSALAYNATNPLSPLLMMSLLSPIIGVSAPSLDGAATLLLGIFLAATTWWVCLSGIVALLRSHLGPKVLSVMNQAAGGVLTIYGLLALARSAGL